MAKPIKVTPTLYGRDALEFCKKIAANEKNRPSTVEYDRVMSIYSKVKLKGKIER